MSERFFCKKENYEYSSTNFSRLLNHVWDKHGLESGFMCVCGISGCQSSYSNLQSFRRHVSKQHAWFFDTFFKIYYKNDQSNDKHSEHSNSDDIEQYFAAEIRENTDKDLEAPDNENLISQLLLELREKFNVTPEATMFLSEKILNSIRIDQKEHSTKIYRSLKQNQNNFKLHHETNVILFSRSPFELPREHFFVGKRL